MLSDISLGSATVIDNNDAERSLHGATVSRSKLAVVRKRSRLRDRRDPDQLPWPNASTTRSNHSPTCTTPSTAWPSTPSPNWMPAIA
jgi:hypothetical protein